MKLLFLMLIVVGGVTCSAAAQTNTHPAGHAGVMAEEPRPQSFPVDLATVLRLAGAQNIDIRIAQEKLAEARATHGSAVAQFFPWIAPGITYRRHDNNIQDVAGNIIEVHKQSYAPGASINAQVDLGEAYFHELATRQLTRAAGHAVEAQRQESTAAAAQEYFDLLAASAAIRVSAEAMTISRNYQAEVERAVGAGIAFRGEELRVRVETQRNELAWRRAMEERRLAAARLAQILHLDPAVDLLPTDSELLPVPLASTNKLELVDEALAHRPELKQNAALVSSARHTRDGASYGPLIPTVGAQAFFGGLGGGTDSGRDTFGEQEDYMVGLSWRIGPGGLFDFDRQRGARARLHQAELAGEKVRDDITRQVIEASTRAESLADQIGIAQRTVASAEQALKLAQQRKEFGVGIVLEAIQAEQEWTRARRDYLRAIADFNKAQYAVLRAAGRL